MAIKKGYRGYVFSRPIEDHRVPQHIQNLVIRNHAKKYGLTYQLSGVEYRMKNSFLMLNQIVDELDEYDGIILYSLFMLPKNLKQRQVIIHKLLENGKEIHTAAEDIVLRKKKEVGVINSIFLIEEALNTRTYKENLDGIVKFYAGNA